MIILLVDNREFKFLISEISADMPEHTITLNTLRIGPFFNTWHFFEKQRKDIKMILKNYSRMIYGCFPVFVDKDSIILEYEYYSDPDYSENQLAYTFLTRKPLEIKLISFPEYDSLY